MAKTLFLCEEIPEETFFFELEGDYSHLNGVYINADHPKGVTQKKWEKLQDELSKLIYRTSEEVEAFRKENLVDEAKVWKKISKINAPTKDWDHFVKCGFIL